MIRFMLGKNKVMQVALGTCAEDEYRDNLHEISAVSGLCLEIATAALTVAHPFPPFTACRGQCGIALH